MDLHTLDPNSSPNRTTHPDDAGAAAASTVRRLAELSLHPGIALVPEMPAAEYESLRRDIEARGILVPIEVTATNVVLDGRHRLRAARDLGLGQVPARVVDPGDELTYIVSAAIHRRHLSASQRAALALELSEYQKRLRRGRSRQRANLRHAQDIEVATLPPPSGRVCEYIAQLAGVCPRLAQDAITVKEEDPELFQRVKAGELPATKAARRVRQRRLREHAPDAAPLPDGPFGLIYADPPWSSPNPDTDWAPENHYPTLPLEQIKALPIPAAEDALLFLWAIACQLPQALEVMQTWGFHFVTEAVWVKQSIGPGAWLRYQHEPLLIGARGNARPPEPELRFSSVIQAPRRRHSRKPDELYALLENAYPHASRLELFARGAPRPGWTTWGNEVKQ